MPNILQWEQWVQFSCDVIGRKPPPTTSNHDSASAALSHPSVSSCLVWSSDVARLGRPGSPRQQSPQPELDLTAWNHLKSYNHNPFESFLHTLPPYLAPGDNSATCPWLWPSHSHNRNTTQVSALISDIFRSSSRKHRKASGATPERVSIFFRKVAENPSKISSPRFTSSLPQPKAPPPQKKKNFLHAEATAWL